MSFWIFSSYDLQNIQVAKERLLWGFWDRDAGKKQRKNWRPFIRLYNRLKPNDIVVFQIARTGEVHAIGIIKGKHYDDQTPVWPKEIEQNQVLFPWRVSFSIILFSKEPFVTHYTKIENYLDGYGIGELSEHEFRRILEKIKEKSNIEINLAE
ncbi:hypothetical protein DRN38_02970 [Thermococci archaeon]|nr:MAG: hypothetical protein DRN38_02970 [Thermococci archaeon]